MKQTPNYNLTILEAGDKYLKDYQNDAFSVIDTELKAMNDKINTLDNVEGSILETNQELKNTNAEIIDARAGQTTLGDKIRNIDTQLDTKANKTVIENRRVFSPKFYGNLNWATSYPVTDGKYLKVDETLGSWVNCCDGIILDFQILPNGSISDNTTYYLNPSINWLNYVINKCNELKINIKGVKFHANEIRDNASSLTFTNWFSKYKNIINEVIQVLKCEYVLLFNESPGLLNRSATEVLIVNNYVEYLKSLGFKVGFGGVGLPSYLTTNNYIYDVISYHSYPVIGGKMQKTTLEDSLIAWEENATVRNLLNARVNYPNKEIMLGEAGCSNYWECLSNPEKWNWDWSTLTKDESGKVSALFLYGMFEKLKNSDIDCVCFWYNDPMLTETQKMIKKYL